MTIKPRDATERWSYVSLTAHNVKGDPFWKAVRPDGVPEDAQLKSDIVNARFSPFTLASGVRHGPLLSL